MYTDWLRLAASYVDEKTSFFFSFFSLLFSFAFQFRFVRIVSFRYRYRIVRLLCFSLWLNSLRSMCVTFRIRQRPYTISRFSRSLGVSPRAFEWEYDDRRISRPTSTSCSSCVSSHDFEIRFTDAFSRAIELIKSFFFLSLLSSLSALSLCLSARSLALLYRLVVANLSYVGHIYSIFSSLKIVIELIVYLWNFMLGIIKIFRK